jgi:CubicO group peptidase (beta-lactamase class C family)
VDNLGPFVVVIAFWVFVAIAVVAGVVGSFRNASVWVAKPYATPMKQTAIPISADARTWSVALSVLRLINITLVFLLLFPTFAFAQQEEQWGKIVTGLMRQGNIPGLSIAVIRDGKIMWEGEFGQKSAVKNRATDGPVLRDTLFTAASLSKPVFAYIVLRLADRGVIGLDRPLYTYGFSYGRVDKDPRSKLITARMVLDHTTGLPNWGGTPLEFLFTPGCRASRQLGQNT